MDYDKEIEKSIRLYNKTKNENHAFDVVTLKMKKQAKESKRHRTLAWVLFGLIPAMVVTQIILMWLTTK